MRKTIYYRDNRTGELYTEREAKGISGLKKVYRSIDEINKSQYYGRYVDEPFRDSSEYCCQNVSEISSKQLRNRKLNKQMIALGLL